jgi:formylmethanofuran dehydrogenase subunit E
LNALAELLEASAALHHHLCPRQVIGVRMGLRAGRELGLTLPQTDKRLIAFVETDGCFADGVAVATGCWVGKRTLRVVDYGKVAATFVDSVTERAVRLAARSSGRAAAAACAPEARGRWEAQLLGYQRLPDEALLDIQPVTLDTPIGQIVSQAGRRTMCEACGEEILNEREVVVNGVVLCQACAKGAYYLPGGVPLGDTGQFLSVRCGQGSAQDGPGSPARCALLSATAGAARR